jgi:hypothetical protein
LLLEKKLETTSHAGPLPACLTPWKWAFSRLLATCPYHQKTKKAGVAEHPEVFDHAGLLIDEPSSMLECSSFSHPTTVCFWR